MSKKSSPKKTKEEEVPTPGATEQDSQFNVVAKDEITPPETANETQVQSPSTSGVETSTESQPEAQADVTPSANPEPPAEVIPPAQAEPDVKLQEPAKPKPLTMIALKQEIDQLRTLIQAQSQQIADFLSGPVLKRKPVANGKVQIKDTQTGKVYPSKNNVYQSLLKAGELKDLVDKGIFGEIPAKNSFGWYALNREFKNRFVEIKPEKQEPSNEAQ